MRRAVTRPQQFATFSTTVDEAMKTVSDALKFSGYSEIDFTIPEDAKVYDAVQKFAGFNIGCLVVTDKAGTFQRVKRGRLVDRVRDMPWPCLQRKLYM